MKLLDKAAVAYALWFIPFLGIYSRETLPQNFTIGFFLVERDSHVGYLRSWKRLPQTRTKPKVNRMKELIKSSFKSKRLFWRERIEGLETNNANQISCLFFLVVNNTLNVYLIHCKSPSFKVVFCVFFLIFYLIFNF